MGESLGRFGGASNKGANLPAFSGESLAGVTADEAGSSGDNDAPSESRRDWFQRKRLFRDRTASADRRGWVKHRLLFAARCGISRCAADHDSIEEQKYAHREQYVRPARRIEREGPHTPYDEHHYRNDNAWIHAPLVR